MALLAAIAIPSCSESKSGGDDAASGGDSKGPALSKHEELADKTAGLMDDFVAAMTSVSDEETAKAAAEKLDKIGDDMVAVVEELKGLDEPAEELKKKLAEKMEAKEKEIEKAMNDDFGPKMEKLSEEAQGTLMEAFMKFGQTMEPLEEELDKHFKVAGEDEGDDEPVDGGDEDGE